MKQLGPIAVFLLPLIIIFDVVQYVLQRSSCMTCGNIPQFIAQSSLAAHILTQTWTSLRHSWSNKNTQ